MKEILQALKESRRVKESYMPYDSYWWLAIGLDSNPQKVVILHFKKERQAEKVADYYENVSDVTIFFVDRLGFMVASDIEKRYPNSKTYDGLWISQHPENYVNTLHSDLTESIKAERLKGGEVIIIGDGVPVTMGDNGRLSIYQAGQYTTLDDGEIHTTDTPRMRLNLTDRDIDKLIQLLTLAK